MCADLNNKNTGAKNKVFVVIGLTGLFLSILLFPPVFSTYLAMAPLFEFQVYQLRIFAVCLFVFSLLLILFRSKFKPALGLLFLSGLLLISLELAVRLGVNIFAPQSKLTLARLGNRTYPHLMAFRGHPFVQFTGNPSSALIGDKILGNLTPFNNFGFFGRDFQIEKTPNTVRIVALGGSTTATGYPKKMEVFLNENKHDTSYQYEVMNFGMGWYNSAHLLVNFILNIVDFAPDYIVIHTGWNDRKARNAVGGFRGDYSHALKNFQPPEVIDRYPIRWSVFYRYFKFKITPEPFYWFLENATRKKYKKNFQKMWQNLDELKPYERNIRTIVELARLRGIKIILTTQPHTTDPAIRLFHETIHIDQCNTIMRNLHQELEGTYFVDLDKLMTGKMNEVFRDVAHVTPKGLAFKAEQIGQLILEHHS